MHSAILVTALTALIGCHSAQPVSCQATGQPYQEDYTDMIYIGNTTVGNISQPNYIYSAKTRTVQAISCLYDDGSRKTHSEEVNNEQ